MTGRRMRSQHGMVTAELAVAISASVVVMIMLCWGIFLLVLQLRLVDSAGAVARQAARGDQTAVRQAKAHAPRGSEIRIERSGSRTAVTVSVVADPFGALSPSVRLAAHAEVTNEPGVSG